MVSLRPIFRGLYKQPGFSALAILTLALGIGVNVAIFSALESLVLNPLPFPDANRLVAVYEDAAWVGYAKNTPAPANFLDWKAQSKHLWIWRRQPDAVRSLPAMPLRKKSDAV
jgi:hypothetical protein